MPRPFTRTPGFVLMLCFTTILLDGYDLVVYGTTTGSLMKQFGVDKAAVANVHSLTLAGLMIGFLVAGPLADRIGRRVVMISGVAVFSVLCLVCAFAPSFELFAAGRVLSGVGLGAVVPSAVSIASEFAPARRRQLFNGMTLIGYPVGGVLATLVGLAVLPSAEVISAADPANEAWRWMYAVGGLGLLLAPVLHLLLPESPGYLAARGRHDEAERVATRYGVSIAVGLPESGAVETAPGNASSNAPSGVRLLFTPRYVIATIVFTLVMFCTQILTYGPSTWLPSMVGEMDFGGATGILALMMLQIGAVVGTIVGANLADRGGATRTVVPYFLLGAFSLFVLAFSGDLGPVILFVAAFLAGVGTIGTSTLMYGVIAAHYPTSARASAIGFCLGLGRVGGILGPQIGAIFVTARSGLLAFMVPALLGAVLVLVLATVGRTRERDRGASVPAPEAERIPPGERAPSEKSPIR
ncbi:MAG: MFS transporter [Gordonia sp. (in: high G+C Gram-positive bacteria)]|uniref:MFS transporter n=1 Tax=Gordonia sp. (in: high G+C Gram-positive bacteria) TaxID=84139 RepID=UPI0039E29DA1